jgi:tripartite-type tricarboxylate transporter receptor subunit TctC
VGSKYAYLTPTPTLPLSGGGRNLPHRSPHPFGYALAACSFLRVKGGGIRWESACATSRTIGSILAFVLTIISIGAAHADAISDFYKGRAINLIVSSSAGGGYDTLARTVARFLGQHVPGNPVIIVKNMAGAGGITATNFLYNASEKDGSQIGLLQNNTPFEPLLGAKEARYDPSKFNWLGTPSVETGILVVWNASPVNSLADITRHETTVGAAGINSTPAFYARLINDVFGTRLKVIVGYPGQTEAFMAMERGEIEGYPSVFLSTLQATKADWLPEKKIKPLLYYGPERRPELARVPYAPELVTNEDDKALLDAAFAPLALGRPLVMPPGVPPERLAAIRKALADTFADSDFIAESKRLGLGGDGDAARDGEAVRDAIHRAYATPARVLDRLRKLNTVPR